MVTYRDLYPISVDQAIVGINLQRHLGLKSPPPHAQGSPRLTGLGRLVHAWAGPWSGAGVFVHNYWPRSGALRVQDRLATSVHQIRHDQKELSPNGRVGALRAHCVQCRYNKS